MSSSKLNNIRNKINITQSQSSEYSKIKGKVTYKTPIDIDSDKNDGAEQFMGFLEYYNSSESRFEILKEIFRIMEMISSNYPKVYKDDFIDPDSSKERTGEQYIKDEILSVISLGDKEDRELVSIVSKTPYSLFYSVIDGGFSDIMFHMDGIKISDSIEVRDVLIPENLKEIYRFSLDHFISTVTRIGAGSGNQQKIDKADPILNSEMNIGDVGILRYNIIHGSLNARSSWPTVVIRKQTASVLKMNDNYLDSLGISEDQKDYIKKSSMQGVTFIFGEVGSGKTTLMKYMAGYKLEEKRNLITIEDTPELGIPTAIALTTSDKYGIQELFQEALRQNPSGLAIGESRDDAIIDILEASLVTRFAMTTLHASSLIKVVQRIIMMARPRKIPREDVENLIKTTVGTFIFIEGREIKNIWRNTEDMSKSVYEIFEEVLL